MAARGEPAGAGHESHRRGPVRVIIADDAVLVRQGVARLLEDEGFEVIDQLDDAGELLARVEQHCTDVVIVDIRMPPTQTTEGLEEALEIKQRLPGVGVLRSPSTSSPGMPCGSSPAGRESATCWRSEWPMPTP